MKPCEGFIFETDRLPLLIVSFPPRRLVAADWYFYIDFIESFFRNKKQFYWIIDIRNASIIDPIFLYKTAVWVKDNRENFDQYCFGSAYVVNNSIIKHSARLFLNTLGSGKIIGPITFFEDLTAAVGWGTEYLTKKGVAIPAGASEK